MKVRVSTLSPQGMEIKTTLPLEPLNARMSEGRDNDIVFTSAPQVALQVTRHPGGAESKGTVTAQYTQPCGRCDKQVTQDIEVAANFFFAPIPEGEDAEDNRAYEDDVGISYYEGDHIDLEQVLQEALILSLSKYYQPALEPDGRCAKCGLKAPQDHDAGKKMKTSLGDLLKKAGLN